MGTVTFRVPRICFLKMPKNADFFAVLEAFLRLLRLIKDFLRHSLTYRLLMSTSYKPVDTPLRLMCALEVLLKTYLIAA